jgi:hypothetical protein
LKVKLWDLNSSAIRTNIRFEVIVNKTEQMFSPCVDRDRDGVEKVDYSI